MIIDHSTIEAMKTVAVSAFKTHLLALLAEVQRTGDPLLVTKRGRPLARVEPVRESPIRSFKGRWKGRVRILGDVVAPASDPSEWEALRE
jgi:prevent-host-death family protein